MYKYYHYISREDNAIEIKTYAMMQNQELTIIQRNSLKSEKFSAYSEKKHNIKTKSGGAFFFTKRPLIRYNLSSAITH